MTILVESYDYKTRRVFLCVGSDAAENRNARWHSERSSLWSFWCVLSVVMSLADGFAVHL
jgi:hypothetical protein